MNTSNTSRTESVYLSNRLFNIYLLAFRYCSRKLEGSSSLPVWVCTIAVGIYLNKANRSSSVWRSCICIGIVEFKCNRDLAMHNQCSFVLGVWEYMKLAILLGKMPYGSRILNFFESSWQPWMRFYWAKSRIRELAIDHASWLA